MGGTDARKAAEQAALHALRGRVDAVGILADAVERRTTAADGPAQADTKAADLLATARAEGRRLRQAAREEIFAADAHYAAVWTAATEAGWSVEELAGLGYPTRARRRSRGGRGPGTDTDSGADATPQDVHPG